jgi:DNA-binding winged helix-turn-helix (wHTH) protein
VIRFGDFELDETRRELRRSGASVPVQPKVLELLAFLIRHRERVVPQAELLRALWPDAVVTSASLARALKEARRALGDDGATQRVIRTHRGGGYRFVAALDAAVEAVRTSGSDYVGRAALLAALDASLVRASEGRGAAVLLVGPAGIGKTRTATELAKQAERRGARVVWSRCAGAEWASPLWPWRRLVAALERRVADRGAPLDRVRAFEESVEAIERAAARGPLLLMIDDLHEADAGSAALLALLAPELRAQPVLFVATYRRDALERRPELARERARLLRHENVIEHELPPLDADELARFVAQRAGAAPPASVVGALLDATQGNPLWVGEVVRGGLGAAGAAIDVDWQDLVSRGFEQVLGERLARLAAPIRGVVEAAAVVGEEVDADLLAAVVKGDVEDALADLRREGLLLASEPDPARHRFAHAVFREALLGGMSEQRRADLHAQVARALEARGAGERGVEAVARHWIEAGLRGDPVRAVEWARRAGSRALAAQGWAAAARLFERAVSLADAGGVEPETRCELLLRLAEAQSRAGDRDAARGAADRAAALARAHGWPARLGEATLLRAGPPFQYRRPDPQTSASLDAALGALASEHLALAARLHARRAAEHVLDPDPGVAAALRARAVDAALSCGDADVLAEVLMTPYSGIWEHVEPARRLALADACVERAQAQGNHIAEMRGALLRLGELLGLGAFAAFDAAVDTLEAATIEQHEPTGRYQILLHRTTRALAAGDLPRAEQRAEQALAVGRRADITGAFELFAATLLVIRREQGRLLELQALTPPLFVGHPSPAARVFEVWGAAEIGDLERARPLCASALDDMLPTLAAQPTGVANAALLARTMFVLGVRDSEPVDALAALLEPYADRVVLRGTLTAHGPAAYFLGLLAWSSGRADEVTARFDAARAFCRERGAAGWGAQIDFDAAQWAVERGDLHAARDAATRASRAARALGMAQLAPAAEALLARI